MSTRRKSTVNIPRTRRVDDETPALQLERLEQETTLVLQEIDHNLSQANAVINDKMVPILRRYASATLQVWTNVSFWKRFLEEAADVEISTVDDPLENTQAKTQTQTQTRLSAGKPLNSDSTAAPELPPTPHNGLRAASPARITASTPQRSRPLLLSSQADATPLPKASHVSPYKRNPARRLSVLQNFLNSSPTLPEPPVLLSEVGRHQPSSSSHADPAGAAAGLSSDSDDQNLVLLPVLLPSVSLTPGRVGRVPLSGQRFPNTPNFAASVNLGAQVSPVRRAAMHRYDDSDLPLPTVTAASRADESDELPPPDLRTIRVSGLGAIIGERESKNTGKEDTQRENREESVKRRKVDDADNVFLEAGSRNTSTVYHTVHEGGSVSLVFEEVLRGQVHEIETAQESENVIEKVSEEVSDKVHGEKGLHTTDGDSGENAGENSGENVSRGEDVPTVGGANTADLPADSPNLVNLANIPDLAPAPLDTEKTEHSHSIDSSNSELGSFLGQRWKSLSRSLRKS